MDANSAKNINIPQKPNPVKIFWWCNIFVIIIETFIVCYVLFLLLLFVMIPSINAMLLTVGQGVTFKERGVYYFVYLYFYQQEEKKYKHDQNESAN